MAESCNRSSDNNYPFLIGRLDLIELELKTSYYNVLSCVKWTSEINDAFITNAIQKACSGTNDIVIVAQLCDTSKMPTNISKTIQETRYEILSHPRQLLSSKSRSLRDSRSFTPSIRDTSITRNCYTYVEIQQIIDRCKNLNWYLQDKKTTDDITYIRIVVTTNKLDPETPNLARDGSVTAGQIIKQDTPKANQPLTEIQRHQLINLLCLRDAPCNQNGSGAKLDKTIRILGRERRVYRIGRRQAIKYKGIFVFLSVARHLEKHKNTTEH